jgi:hypothetical protein
MSVNNLLLQIALNLIVALSNSRTLELPLPKNSSARTLSLCERN